MRRQKLCRIVDNVKKLFISFWLGGIEVGLIFLSSISVKIDQFKIFKLKALKAQFDQFLKCLN